MTVEIENKIQLQSSQKGEGRNSKGINIVLVSDEPFFSKYIQKQNQISLYSTVFYFLYSVLDREPNGSQGSRSQMK